jgi:hypothetical protein
MFLMLSMGYIKISLESVKLNLEGSALSADMPIGLTVVEKVFGLILIIIGAIIAYSSINPPAGDISHFAGIFTVTGVLVAIVGVFLLVTKAE